MHETRLSIECECYRAQVYWRLRGGQSRYLYGACLKYSLRGNIWTRHTMALIMCSGKLMIWLPSSASNTWDGDLLDQVGNQTGCYSSSSSIKPKFIKYFSTNLWISRCQKNREYLRAWWAMIYSSTTWTSCIVMLSFRRWQRWDMGGLIFQIITFLNFNLLIYFLDKVKTSI